MEEAAGTYPTGQGAGCSTALDVSGRNQWRAGVRTCSPKRMQAAATSSAGRRRVARLPHPADTGSDRQLDVVVVEDPVVGAARSLP
jgi:hypothetical protein